MPPKKDSNSLEFEKAAEELGFTTKTVKILLDNGFESIDDLSLLADCGDLDSLGLSLAQKLKLKKYVQGSTQENTTSTKLDEVLKGIHVDVQGQADKGTSSSIAAHTAPTESSIADPLVYLRDHSGGCKHRDIADYVYLVSPVAEDHVISEEGGVQVLFRTAPRKPRLQNISIEEWALANTRIMDAMYSNNELIGPALRDYLAYTAKVCELFRLYDRVTVLQYDREYRYMQAQFQFRWATDAPHLHTVHLRPKTKTPSGPSTSSGVSRSAQQRRDQVCRLFNHSRDGCTYGESCKFRHVCSEPGCNQAHPRRDHHSPSSSGQASARLDDFLTTQS